MKKTLLLLQILFISSLVFAQNNKTQLQLHSFMESKSEGGLENLGTFFQKGWPKDINGDKDCAWVRVTFENFMESDASAVTYNFGNTAPIVHIKNRLKENENEMWIFVTPSENAIMEASLTKYGKSNRIPDIKLEPRHVYDVVLKNDKTLSINISTKPEGITVLLETGQSSTTPATITDVAIGKHTVTLSKEGKTLKTSTIYVTENNVSFEYDLRKRKHMKFTSKPNNATLYLNGQEIGKTPCEIELAYDSYNIKAVSKKDEVDSRSFTVGDNFPSEITLEPVPKKTFEIISLYNGEKVPASLYVDDKLYGENEYCYNITRPVGKDCKIKLTYNGRKISKNIKVSSKMEDVQEFDFSNNSSHNWMRNLKLKKSAFGISIGYVGKQVDVSGKGKEEPSWNTPGRILSGLQIGVNYQTCFKYGLGLYTGLFYERYYSTEGGSNKFYGHCMYVPAHILYKIPLYKERIALVIHSGIGMTYIINNKYEDDYSSCDSFNNLQKCNLTADLSIGFDIGRFEISGTYNKGLTNHKNYDKDGNKSHLNKFSVNFAYHL